MITIQHLREMNKRDFAKALRKLNKNNIIEILEVEGIWVKSSSKTDELIDILLDVVDGIRTSTKEDVNKLNAKNKRRETIRKNKERRRLEEEERNRQRVNKEKSLEEIWNDFNYKEKSLIYLYYCFENDVCHTVPFDTMGFMFRLNGDLLPYEFMRNVEDIYKFEDWESEDFEGCRKMMLYIHPDTHQNYSTSKFVDLSKYINEFKNLFKIGR